VDQRESFATVDALHSRGFVGFRTIAELRQNKLTEVPEVNGVYLILRATAGDPRFLTTSTGGRFKGRDPTVDVAVLTRCWITDTPVLYIGKAGGDDTNSTLRSRLRLSGDQAADGGVVQVEQVPRERADEQQGDQPDRQRAQEPEQARRRPDRLKKPLARLESDGGQEQCDPQLAEREVDAVGAGPGGGGRPGNRGRAAVRS
jgi:hypothetical protein